MAKAWLNIGDSRDDAIEDEMLELSQPDAVEAESLPLHIKRCALRYRSLMMRSNRMSRQLGLMTLLLALTLGFDIITNPKVGQLVKFFLP